MKGRFAVRQDNWVFIDDATGGDNEDASATARSAMDSSDGRRRTCWRTETARLICETSKACLEWANPSDLALILPPMANAASHGPAFSHTSTDDGETWIRGGRLCEYQGVVAALEAVAVQIQNVKYGRIVIPYYFEMKGEHPDYTRQQKGGYAIWKGRKILLQTHTHVPEMAGSFVVYSDDDGETWKTSAGFLMGYFEDGHMGHLSCEEPVVAELKDGRLLCYMRSTTGRILKSYSADGGESWTQVEWTDVPMSNSPCALARIPGKGDLVMVWNQMSAGEIEEGYRRGRLTVGISTDDGESWKNLRILELSPGCDRTTDIETPPKAAMVRGAQGPDEAMSEVPDGFTHFHYPQIHFSEEGDKVFIYYLVSPPEGEASSKWRAFPVSSLYES